MPRLQRDDEEEKRKQADELIQFYALQTKKAVYFSPANVAEEAIKRGLQIDRQYFFRRYAERGIVFENGLWCKDLE